MNRLRLIILVSVAVLLTGCGDLETEYGVREGDSVNGVRLLHDELAARSELRDAWLLSPRLDDRDLLIHLQTTSGLPDVKTCTWLTHWLNEGDDPRQAVLILRDGNVAPYLCRTWADEARAEGLMPLTEMLTARAEREAQDELPDGTATETCPAFSRQSGRRRVPQHLTGLGLDGMHVPPTLQFGAHPVAGAHDTVLVAADGVPLVVAYPVGEVNRLIVVANATGLLDGALADARARRLTTALLDEILRFHAQGKPAAAWVGSLRVRESEPENLNLLAFLRIAPFAWPLWHLLALLVVAAVAAAAWLGRRELRRDRRGERFARHIDALGQHYADAARSDPAIAREAAVALAAAWGRPPPPAAVCDVDSALAWLKTAPVPSHSNPTVPRDAHGR